MIWSYLAWITAAAFVFFQFFLQSAATIMGEAWAHDFQVKLRGFRIELGEIESAVSKLPAIKQSIVILREEEEHRYLA